MEEGVIGPRRAIIGLVLIVLTTGAVTLMTGWRQRRVIDFSTPEATLITLRAAIHRADWETASECFSDSVQERHSSSIQTRAFYLTDHWIKTRTVQNALAPIPVLGPDAQFRVIQVSPTLARVLIEYPKPVDKDVRARHVGLQMSSSGQWKVTELYEISRVPTTGGGAPE